MKTFVRPSQIFVVPSGEKSTQTFHLPGSIGTPTAVIASCIHPSMAAARKKCQPIFNATPSRNQRSADSFVRAKAPMRQEHADKAVRAPEKSSRRTMILTYCSAKAQRGIAATKSFWTAAGSEAPRRFGNAVSSRKAVSPLLSATAVQNLQTSEPASKLRHYYFFLVLVLVLVLEMLRKIRRRGRGAKLNFQTAFSPALPGRFVKEYSRGDGHVQ